MSYRIHTKLTMATIDLEQVDLLQDYQIYSKYFSGTALEKCAEYKLISEQQEIYHLLESSNHSQVLIQRLLVGADPQNLLGLFNFFCKNSYLEIKPCSNFIPDADGILKLFFIGHNDNRSLFGESSSMMFNFVAKAQLLEINHEEKTIQINLEFVPFTVLDRDFDESTHSHKVISSTIAEIASKHRYNPVELIKNVLAFSYLHSLDQKSSIAIINGLTSYANKRLDGNLPFSAMHSTVQVIREFDLLSLSNAQSLGEVINVLKQNKFNMICNYDLSFYSSKDGREYTASALYEYIRTHQAQDFLGQIWFAIINPINTQVHS